MNKAPVRVLLVDDDTRTARLLAHMLREDGFEVELAWDGAAALGRLSKNPLPDILVTDLELPHVDGLALAQFARTRAPKIPIVIVTGYPNLAANAEEDSVVLTKPLDYARLTDELRRASKSSRKKSLG
jgi:CheY-like chemotaxis protein